MNPLLILVGVATAGLILLGGSMQSSTTALPSMSSLPPWVQKVLLIVIGTESGFKWDAMNLNKDGHGLSFGIIQWAQGPGSLGGLLRAMHDADPARFECIMGPSWAQVIEVASLTRPRSLAPVDGAVLWVEPWVSRFRELGQDPVFQSVQLATATTDKHWQGGIAVARYLGVTSERALALFYDTSVNSGPTGAMRFAERARAHLTQSGAVEIPQTALLAEYARQAWLPWYVAPGGKPPAAAKPGVVWKQAADGSWHGWQGSFDMYKGIKDRRTRILVDATLSDAAIAV